MSSDITQIDFDNQCGRCGYARDTAGNCFCNSPLDMLCRAEHVPDSWECHRCRMVNAPSQKQCSCTGMKHTVLWPDPNNTTATVT